MLLNSEDIFLRLMSICQTSTLKELSEMLGYKYNWATTSKKREVIPYEACSIAVEKFNTSMDFLLYGIDHTPKKMDINELKISITEGIFAAVQQEMITLNKNVKISTMANMITNEIIENCDIETQDTKKEAI
jgi:hypothetical protein